LRKNIREQTVLGQQARQYVADGKLVPDDLLISLIDDEILNVGNTVSWRNIYNH
jgi:adenylate kinase family enzyme